MESLEEQSKGGVQRILVALPLWSKFDSGVDGSLGVDILGAISWTNDMRGERDELAGVAATSASATDPAVDKQSSFQYRSNELCLLDSPLI